MALFKFFDTRELEQFADVLATELGRKFPPASEARTDAGAANQLKSILDALALRALRYHEQNKLGVYRKAKLGNVFRWRLKTLGYSEAFVETATDAIIQRLAAS